MNHEQFEQIVERFHGLERRERELGRHTQALLYNTEGNSHHPLAFASLEDALTHQDLSEQIDEVNVEQTTLAVEAQQAGFPPERWIKIEGAEASDDEATGIRLYETRNGGPRLISEDWSLVLADG